MKTENGSVFLIREARKLVLKTKVPAIDKTKHIRLARFQNQFSEKGIVTKPFQVRDSAYRVMNEFERMNGKINFGLVPYRVGNKFGGLIKIDTKSVLGRKIYLAYVAKYQALNLRRKDDGDFRVKIALEKKLITLEEFKLLTSSSKEDKNKLLDSLSKEEKKKA